MRLRTYRPTAPLVINLIALFIVLGGQAVALSGHKRVKANDFARGSVTARNLATGAVTRAKLGGHAVTAKTLGTSVVTGRMIKTGIVRGPDLTGTFQIPATIADADPAGPMGSDGNWTASGGTATCPSESRLLGGGIKLQDSASHRAFIQSTFPSSNNVSTWVGEISTDTGGASPGLLYAHCLR